MRFNVLFPAFAALSLAACDSGTEAPAPAESETGAGTPTAAATPVELPTEIPAAFQGRFGLTPDDCTSTAGDAKGLLEITGTELKFYESVGKLLEESLADGPSADDTVSGAQGAGEAGLFLERRQGRDAGALAHAHRV